MIDWEMLLPIEFVQMTIHQRKADEMSIDFIALIRLSL
jgi:hypothetical protein